MIFYKFLPERFAKEAIELGRLKLSDLPCTNDDSEPISLLRFSHVDLVPYRNEVFKSVWTTCLTETRRPIRMWQSYAEQGHGRCLGFDSSFPLEKIRYSAGGMISPGKSLSLNQREKLRLVCRMNVTKHRSWSYERERRFFVKVTDPPDAEGRQFVSIAAGGSGTNDPVRRFVCGKSSLVITLR